MALLYVFVVNNPKLGDVGNFPPNVDSSDWNKHRNNLIKNLLTIDHNSSTLRHAIIVQNEDELNQLINQLRLPEEFKASVQEWKEVHGITYEHKIYQLPEFESSIDLNWLV